MRFLLLAFWLSFCLPILTMEKRGGDFENEDDSLIAFQQTEEIVGTVFEAVEHEVNAATLALKNVVTDISNSNASTCFRCRGSIDPESLFTFSLGNLRIYVHKNCFYGLPLTAIDRTCHKIAQIANDLSDCAREKIKQESDKFDEAFGNSILAKQLFIKALLLEGLVYGSAAYFTCATFVLEHLNCFRWWVVQAALLAIPDKFLYVSHNMPHNIIFKQSLILVLAYMINKKQNLAHLLLLNSVNSWLKPQFDTLIPALSKCTSYGDIKKKLAENYKQKAFLVIGGIAGFCVLAPKLNDVIAYGCTMATQKAQQLLHL